MRPLSERPTIVLVPGFMTDQDLWRDLVLQLQGYNLICSDLAAGHSLEEIASYILRQCPPKFVLLGFSLGGYVARHIAYQAGDRVTALVLVATSARAGSPSSRPTSVETQSFKGLSTAAVRQALGPDSSEEPDLILRIKEMGARLGADVYKRLSLLERPSDLHALQQIQCPALVICAEHDRLRSREESEEIVAAMRANFAVIEGSGHMVPLEQPRRLAQVVRDWLERVL